MNQPNKWGRIAVLMGGTSAERAISLKSGNAVLAALLRRGVDAVGIDVGADILDRLSKEHIMRIFIALHGRGGEDGTLQGALEILGLPYTGSGVLGSALAMDKCRSKYLWDALDLPTPAFRILNAETDWEQVAAELGLPMAVKPVREGSSLGITRVEHPNDLRAAYEHAVVFDRVVIAERWIVGKEYTIGMVDDLMLPVIELQPARGFYDYYAKYQADDTRYLVPCGLSAAEESMLQDLARQAFNALGCSGWGRVDIMRDMNGAPWLLEVNTAPGMTDHSLVPMAARALGIDFDELVMRILVAGAHDA